MALSLAELQRLLGWPDRPRAAPSARVRPAAPHPVPGGTRLDLDFAFETGPSRGILLLPDGPEPHPAVLYCHAHGNAYAIGAEELTEGRPALQAPYGPDLLAAGFAALSIDLPLFGSRQSEAGEAALAKAALWHGRPLMGQMLAELHAAFSWLADHPQIDPARIATLGLSMGATHAYWLAALDPRVAACAHLCAFAQIGPLIQSGAHDLHGPYMTVPGLLSAGDMGDVAAQVAPRPQLICAGRRDPLTPPDALDPALERVAQSYAADGPLEILVDPATGHAETAEMRAAVLAFLARHLGHAPA